MLNELDLARYRLRVVALRGKKRRWHYGAILERRVALRELSSSRCGAERWGTVKRNEIPIDLTGFADFAVVLLAMQGRIEQLDRQALEHWVELIPQPVQNTRRKLKLVEAA